MAVIRCTIHQVDFVCDRLPKDHRDYEVHLECPYCLSVAKGQLREELARVKSERAVNTSV